MEAESMADFEEYLSYQPKFCINKLGLIRMLCSPKESSNASKSIVNVFTNDYDRYFNFWLITLYGVIGA
jgi:hypothetical protein